MFKIGIILFVLSGILTIVEKIVGSDHQAWKYVLIAGALVTTLIGIIGLPVSDPVLIVSEDRTGIYFSDTEYIFEVTEYCVREKDTDNVSWSKYKKGDVIKISHDPSIVMYRNRFFINTSNTISTRVHVDKDGVRAFDVIPEIKHISATYIEKKASESQPGNTYAGYYLEERDFSVIGIDRNGEEVQLIEGFTYSPVQLKEGNNSIEIQFVDTEGTTSTCKVSIYGYEPRLISISAELKSVHKGKIKTGDKLVPSMFEVIGEYEDGKKKSISDFLIEPADVPDQEGVCKVAIVKDGISEEMNITVATDLGRSTCLTDLKPFGNTSVETYLPSQIDNYGNSYTKILSCNNGYGEYNEVEYSLGGNYGSFTGIFFVTKASVDHVGNFSSSKPEIRIYGDNVLLYTKKGCNYKDEPEKFLVNIKNVNFLKIVFDGACYYESWGWERPLLVIGEPTLWENTGKETPPLYKGKQSIRTRIIELEPYGNTNVKTSQPVQYTTDNYGNSYNYVLSCDGSYASCDEVEYYLGEKYTELTGTFYVTQASVENVGDFESDLPEIRIYGDEELLYTKKGCTSKDAPEEFTVDLRGVEFLKVVFDGTYYNETWGWKRPLLVIGEPVLWEAVE